MGADESVDVRIERVPVEATLELRQRVLRPHQELSEVVSSRERAPDAVHVAALMPDGTVVGTATVIEQAAPWGAPGWRLRGMATDGGLRGRGIGARLLAAVVDHVREQGGGLLWCNARIPAIRFYERAGLQTRGEPWEEPEIGPHVVMWRQV